MQSGRVAEEKRRAAEAEERRVADEAAKAEKARRAEERRATKNFYSLEADDRLAQSGLVGHRADEHTSLSVTRQFLVLLELML